MVAGALDEIDNAFTVDLVVRQFGPDQLRDRWQNVDRHRRRAADGVGRYGSGPPHERAFTATTVEHRALALAERRGRAGVVAVTQPRAVVGGEDDERVFVELVFAERVEDPADAPVDLHHHVTEQAGPAFALELIGDIQRHVHHRVRHVDEKWTLLVLLDERDGALGVLRGELLLVFAGNLRVDDFVPVDERQVRPPLEALLHRQVHHAGMVRPHVV